MTTDGIDGTPLERRRLLVTIGTGSVAALAGCFGDDEEPDDAELGDDEDGAGGEPAYTTDAPVDELVDFPDGSCEVCAMLPANFPEWNAQIAHENGDRGFCCTPGCAVAYFVSPETFGGPDSPVASFWMTEFETTEFIDAFEATYVLEHETGPIDQPMGRNPYPFADEADAFALVEDYSHLEEDAVVTLEEIDEDVARNYRPGNF